MVRGNRWLWNRSFFAVALATLICVSNSEAAIMVSQNSNAIDLANAVTSFGGSGIAVTNAVRNGHASSTGIFTANGGTYGLSGSGIVLSTGIASQYGSGPNNSSGNSTSFGLGASSGQNALLTPISGLPAHFDVAELLLTFDMLPGFNTVFFNVVFGSEEFPTFVGGSFIDSFGLFVNGNNIAFSGGFPVNINHPAFAAIPGTELNGVLAPQGNPVVTFSAFVGENTRGNTLRFIIGDTADTIIDSTAYISALGGTPPPSSVVPEPISVATWMGMFSLTALARFRRRQAAMN